MEKTNKKFPRKFEVHIEDGGYHEVYLAEEVDQWLKKLQQFLTGVTHAEHGNVARMILKEFFGSLESDNPSAESEKEPGE